MPFVSPRGVNRRIVRVLYKVNTIIHQINIIYKHIGLTLPRTGVISAPYSISCSSALIFFNFNPNQHGGAVMAPSHMFAYCA